MSETTPKDQRGPTNLRIKFRSASLDQFIERYAVDVSAGGIFIRTREPLAVGTQLRLELQLQDAAPLLSGEGTVIWIRENDPSRPTVPPGMAVRFDKVSPETQPTLDRILAERARMEQAGQLPVPQGGGGGMAVRRPSSVLSPLEGGGRVSAPAANAPTAPVAAAGGTSDAGGTGTAAPVATKTSFLASRTAPATAPKPGPFTRARQTSTRPVPVPSALFEPPTAADIDKALSFLEEAPGPAPMPPTPSVPRFVEQEMSNEPTRVGDSAMLAAAAADAIEELPADAIQSETSGPEALQARSPGVPSAVEANATTAERPLPSVPVAPAAPEVSRRFRAASRPYPTLKKRGGAGVVIALIVVVGAAAAAVWKLRPGSQVPLTPSSIPAATIAPAAAPATPPPAAQPAAPSPAPAAQAPAPAAEKPAETKPVEAKPVAEKPAETKATETKAEKPSREDRGSSRHAAHHRGHEETSSARAAAKETAAAKEAAPAEAKPADTAAPAPADNAPAADKPAADKEAAAPADKPAAAKAAVLKITSTPPGADVTIDGSNMGVTPFTSKEVDPTAPHVIRLVKDGFESNERMIGTSDWSRPHGSAPPALKMNVKLRRVGGAPAADTPKDNPAPAEDTGGPYIKEVNPTSP